MLKLFGYFWDRHKIYLVLEFAPYGELFGVMGSMPYGFFLEPQGAHIVRSVAHAIGHMHERGIIHRDLKPENIVIGAGGTIKLADFGWSVHTNSNTRRTFCGTLDYLAPEMVLK